MRPKGEIRQVMQGELARGGGTARELAERAQVGMRAASFTLDRMRSAGEAAVVERRAAPGVRQRVPVYGLAPVPQEAAAGECATRLLGRELRILWL